MIDGVWYGHEGQGHRSEVKVTRSKTIILIDFLLTAPIGLASCPCKVIMEPTLMIDGIWYGHEGQGRRSQGERSQGQKPLF